MDDHRPAVLARDEKAELDSAYRRYGGDYAQRWSSGNTGNREIASELLGILRKLLSAHEDTTDVVLDVGSGATGSFSSVLPSAKRVRFDILEWRLREATSIEEAGPAVCGDGAALPFRSGSVGTVFLSTVLSSVPENTGAAILNEAARVLGVGGVLVVYDFRVRNPSNKATHAVSRAWVKTTLSDFDLEVQSVTVIPQVARRLGSTASWIYPVLARLPFLRTHNIFIATHRP